MVDRRATGFVTLQLIDSATMGQSPGAGVTSMIRETLKDADERMGKAMEALRRDLNTIRTGRASPSASRPRHD